MNKARVLFSKTGRAVYISHLDIMHTMQRAFSRAHLQLHYSEGFNPHPQISIAMPLSVGTSSICELMDFRLDTEIELRDIPARLNEVLPEGIKILDCYSSDAPVSRIKWLKVEGRFDYDSTAPSDAADGLNHLYAEKSLIVQKKTKRGTAEIDLIPSLRDVVFTAAPEKKAVIVSAAVSVNEPVINPMLIADAVRMHAPELAPDFTCFKRIEVFDENMEIFR